MNWPLNVNFEGLILMKKSDFDNSDLSKKDTTMIKTQLFRISVFNSVQLITQHKNIKARHSVKRIFETFSEKCQQR